ncbi:MAG: L,D-transpeptidase [Akkermansiaceae bacterium]|nr:L,D-transpeptidase [Akkermansiaceae bacterium]MDP4648170.1 L,D-transpeptidase [Akkermansiaceae bacterium]MDP4846897.1 L,D-transpeptidase [Akkermansiaceae bacterium]
MKMQRFLFAILALALMASFTSCTMNAAGGGINSYKDYDRPAKLPTNPSAVVVKVSLSKQRVYVTEGGNILLIMPVGIGVPSTPTPTGDFRIYNKTQKYRSPDHGFSYKGDKVKPTALTNKPSGWKFIGTPLPYWCEIKPGISFHTGWVKHSPSTNGAIRMHENLAPKFFRLVSSGTPVNISYRQAEDEDHSNIPLPPDAGPLPDYPNSMYIGEGYFSEHKTPKFD